MSFSIHKQTANTVTILKGEKYVD